eukprot:TRINITY_DN60968_c0_g1_i1.p1 TRINITY_DN60968_c0_g1~~TRINITY_DN60968_c0_g1_i1.p1  ORF type:complete len:355 (-),score=49.42 TRINITY_DN60968_c0_g1_i1:2-1066(-)
MTIAYDGTTGMCASALRYSSTIIPCVITDKEFWILFFMNLIVFLMRKAGLFHPEHFHVDLPWELTGTTGGLMTFFVIFYNNHVFNRYQALYESSMEAMERCTECAQLLCIHISDKRVRTKVAKYMLANICFFFLERSQEGEDSQRRSVSSREWEQVNNLCLLTAEEMQILRDHCELLGDDAIPSFMLLHWSLELLHHATEDHQDRWDMLSCFEDIAYRTWLCQCKVVHCLELPMPYQYFHIMNLMLILNLLLWAYALALQESYFAPLICVFVQMMFQGIRELATSMSNPFGTDDVDFPLDDWVNDIYSRVFYILRRGLTPPQKFSMSKLVAAERTPLVRTRHVSDVILVGAEKP